MTTPLCHQSQILTNLRALAVVALAAPAAFAQSTQAGPAQSNKASDSPVIKMEAFNVSTEIGAYHEETSSMATKIPISLKELPSSLQILNASAIGDRNATTMQDLYGYIIGVTQSQNNTNGFTFRGFPNSGTFTQNIEYDGLQGGIYNQSPTTAANVESVEFLKGPNSVLYGQMHPGGLLNVVTKSPKEVQEVNTRAYVSTYAGRYNNFGAKDGFGATLDFTGPIDQERHWLYRLILDGQNDRPFRPGDYSKNIVLFPAVTYMWDKDAYITLKLEIGQAVSRKDDGIVPIFTSATAFGVNARFYVPPLDTVYQDPTDKARDQGESLSIEFKKAWSRWTLRAQTRSAWHMQSVRVLDTNSTTIFTPKAAYATPATTFARQYANNGSGHRYNYGDANIYGTMGPDNFSSTILLGVGGGQEFNQVKRTGFGPNVAPISVINPVLGQSPYPADGTGVNGASQMQDFFGMYVSDQTKLGDRLHLSVGTRYDQQMAHGIDPWNTVKSPYISQVGRAQTSQAGVVADVTKAWSVYGSWSQSYVPNAVTSVDATGHAGFPAEKGVQYEGGIKVGTSDHRLFASFAGYWLERTNVLVTTGLTIPATKQAIFRLDGAQHSEGVEFEVEWKPIPNWQLQGGVALGKAFVAESVKNPASVGLDLVSAPRVSANFWTRYNVPAGALTGLGLGLGVNYVGKQWCGDPTSTVYFPVDGWARADAAVYYKWKRHSFTLNVQNLLDRKYILAAQNATFLIPGDARKFTFSVQTRF